MWSILSRFLNDIRWHVLGFAFQTRLRHASIKQDAETSHYLPSPREFVAGFEDLEGDAEAINSNLFSMEEQSGILARVQETYLHGTWAILTQKIGSRNYGLQLDRRFVQALQC